MIYWIIGGVIYALSVIYVYGLIKGEEKRLLDGIIKFDGGEVSNKHADFLYSQNCEIVILGCALIAPVTLLIGLYINARTNSRFWTWGPFCFKMPKKYYK